MVEYGPVGQKGTIAFFVGFACLAAATLAFMLMAYLREEGKRGFHVLTITITSMASLSYLYMATGNGYVKVDGEEFYYFRYIDWLITTPLLLVDLAWLSGATIEKTAMLVLLDLLMILSGLLGGLEDSDFKWLFWAMGMVFFFPILYELVFGMFQQVEKVGKNAKALLVGLSVYTVILWCGYPLIWILATGTDVIGLDDEAVVYCCLDVCAKAGFGFILLADHAAMDDVSEHQEAQRIYGRKSESKHTAQTAGA